MAGTGPRLRVAGLALAALLQGCVANPPLDLSALSSRTEPLHLEAVPFFAQKAFQCGPAALAGLLGASGVPARPEALSGQVFLPARQGSLQLELVAATRRAGRLPYTLDPEPAALLAELESGRPVLVLQNLRTRGLPAWHYAVVVGFDARANTLLLNTGTTRAARVRAKEFLRTWDWAGRWALVALRPGELPAHPDAARYIEAAAAFERVASPAQATAAWEAARRAWPAQPLPYLALGNIAHAAGRLPSAAELYAAGLAQATGHAALANNLASVLGELGCPRRAEALLEPVAAAQQTGSAWDATLRSTLKELAARRGADGADCARLPGSPAP